MGFIIRGLNSQLIAVGGVQLVEISMSRAEMREVWEGIYYARLTLRPDRLIVEENFTTVVT